MAIKLRSLRADPETEKKGEWVDSTDFPGVRFRVSPLHAPQYQSALAIIEQRWAREYRGKPVPQSVRIPAIGVLLQKHILHDWAGFDEPYSPEIAAETMSSYEDRPLIAAVQNAAALASVDKYEFVQDEEKNFDPPSDTD